MVQHECELAKQVACDRGAGGGLPICPPHWGVVIPPVVGVS